MLRIVARLNARARAMPARSPFTSVTPALWIATSTFCGLAYFLRRRCIALQKDYDPNSEPVEDAKRRGEELSVSKEEFLKIYSTDRSQPASPPPS